MKGTVINMLERLIAIIAARLGLDVDDITLDSNITEDLGADSLNIVELAFDIENEFSVKATDEEIMGIKTVEDILDFLEKYSERERKADITEGNQISW